MTNFVNYYVDSKFSKLTDGHLKSDQLYEKILNTDQATAYCCYYDLDKDSLKNEFFTGEYDSDNKPINVYLKQGEKGLPTYYAPKLTFAKYEGIAQPSLNMVSFDFDSDDPQNSLDDVRKFCEWLAIKDIAIFYSGSKGFHVMIPFSYFPLVVSPDLPNQLKDIAKELKKFYPTLDTSIYDYSRKFRVPFTRHEKTSRVKSFVPVEYINEWTLDTIIKYSENQKPFDFLADLDIDSPRNALDIFIDLWESVKRNSYAIEKEKAGTKEKPSPFEAYDGKICIKKLLESRCDDVGRNNACMRIVNDFFRTGKTLGYAQDTIFKWAESNGLPRLEATTVINNIYERGANYNFGCQDDIKSSYCSAKCSIWKKLDPDKRPVTVDQPDAATKMRDIKYVDNLLMDIFKCQYDNAKGEYYGGNIIRQGKDDVFFYYKGKWEHMDVNFIDKIKRRFNYSSDLKLDAKKLDALYRLFVTYIPIVPDGVDLFNPNPTVANFNNGTLHLLENIDGKFYLEFKKHNPADYITFKINHDYIEGGKTSEGLIELFDRVFENDEDKQDRIDAIAEMFGASLIPYFPHLFYLYGVAGSGKSSIMLILNYMHNKGDNICSVQPKNFHGFNMESMIGKLVNIVTDVDTRKPIDDDIVKQIEDRIPVTIRRKNKTDIKAPLPSIHIFGGNDLLKSYEGYSAAMKRRWSIIKFNKTYDGPKSRNFAAKVFNDDPQGVINFALYGLNRLVKSQGYFNEFDSSIEALNEWSTESDLIAQFLDEAFHNETDLPLD